MLFNWLRSASRNAVLAGVTDAVRELGAPDSQDPLTALRIHCANVTSLPAPEPSSVEAPVASKGRKRGE